MAVVVIKNLINEEELNKVQEEYGEYVKVVVDIERSAEKVLLDSGSIRSADEGQNVKDY